MNRDNRLKKLESEIGVSEKVEYTKIIVSIGDDKANPEEYIITIIDSKNGKFIRKLTPEEYENTIAKNKNDTQI